MGAAGGVAICPKTSCGRRAMQIARRTKLASGERRGVLQEWDISPVRLSLWLRPDWLQTRRAFANIVAASHRSLQSRHWKESPQRLRVASQAQSTARCHRPQARFARGARGLVFELRANLNPAARLRVWHQTYTHWRLP